MEISLPVTLAVLGAALLHATWNVLVKAGADKELETINVAIGSGLRGPAAGPFFPPPARAPWARGAASAGGANLFFLFLPRGHPRGGGSHTYSGVGGRGAAVVGAGR